MRALGVGSFNPSVSKRRPQQSIEVAAFTQWSMVAGSGGALWLLQFTRVSLVWNGALNNSPTTESYQQRVWTMQLLLPGILLALGLDKVQC
jgi:hypothetical protein